MRDSKQIIFRKNLKKLTSYCLVVLIVLQVFGINVIADSAGAPIKTHIEFFAKSSNQLQTRSVNIPDLFKVIKVTVADTGKAEYTVNDNIVDLTVKNGIPVSYDSINVEIYITKNINEFDEIHPYKQNGYFGELEKEGAAIYNGLTYKQKYSGTAYNYSKPFYEYTVTITYEENAAPQLLLVKPENNKSFNQAINVKGVISDLNQGDQLSVFYEVYEQKNGKLCDKSATGQDQDVEETIDISGIPEGSYSLSLWAVDKKGAKSNTIDFAFEIDRTPPSAPIITGDPKRPTNEDVTVTITYPGDAVDKKVKIGPDGNLEDYTRPIKISVNTAVYAVCSDLAGNNSVETVLVIDNIDKTPPSAPTIITSADETLEKPITVTINPGMDTGSGVDRTEYSVSGATYTPWQLYTGSIEIKNIGKSKIEARTYDKAGNVSETTSKTVEIKSQPIVSSTPGGNPSGTPGGNSSGNPGTNPVNNGTPLVSPGGTNNPTVTPVPLIKEYNPTSVPHGIIGDISVYFKTDKNVYGEGETAVFNIKYRNKTNVPVGGVTIKAEIDRNTTVTDAAGGKIEGNTISWTIGTLEANAAKEINYKLKVNLLDLAEVTVLGKASISSTMPVINPGDDESKLQYLLYSNRYGNKNHKKYIVGYVDKTFRPENKITRAEVAAILVRVLDIEVTSANESNYKDVNKGHWAYDYICEATKSKLFEGYADGTFKPDGLITRAEIATALSRYLSLKSIEPISYSFADIKNHWARNFIEEINRLNLIRGYEDGSFRPESRINRSECVTIINRMLFRGPLNGMDLSFKDVKKTYWAYGHIAESAIDHYYTRNQDGSETKVDK